MIIAKLQTPPRGKAKKTTMFKILETVETI